MSSEKNREHNISVHDKIGKVDKMYTKMDIIMLPEINIFFYKSSDNEAHFIVAVEETSLSIINSSESERALLKNRSKDGEISKQIFFSERINCGERHRKQIYVAKMEQSGFSQIAYNINPNIESSNELFHTWL